MVAALAWWLIFAGVDVAGDGTCPAPSDVARRLAEMTSPHDITITDDLADGSATVDGPHNVHLTKDP